MTDLTIAQEAINDFAARFGPEARAYLDLARHAALPLALTPDLLYLIWFDFRTDEQGEPLKIPWVAVADLLLSHLCKEISNETYAFEDGVRQLLRQQMVEDTRFGLARVRRLAAFLDQYAERQLHSDNPYTKEAGQAQRLTAYAAGNPKQLVAYLTQLYERPLPQSQMIRYATLMETLKAPVTAFAQDDAATQQAFAEAQVVGRSLAEWARGDLDTAVAQLQAQFGTNVTIGDTAVSLPEDMQQILRGDVSEQGDRDETVVSAGEDLPAFFNDYVDRMMFDASPWLEAALRAVGAWQQAPDRENIMLITGQPGSGKTNLAVNLVKQVRDQSSQFGIMPQMVGAYHFCMEDRPDTLDGRLFVGSVLQQLAERFPGFRGAGPIYDPDAPWEQFVKEQLIQPLDSLTVSDYTSMSQTPPAKQELLIIVENVDAAMRQNSWEQILDACLQLVDTLPQVRLLLTTRQSTAVRDALDPYRYTYFTLDTVYRNFDFRIQEAITKPPAREVAVLASPTGELSSPFIITHDEELVEKINQELSNVTLETARDYIGSDLFQTFFTKEVRKLLRASLEQVRQVGERLRLRLFLPSEGYISLPWEWLYEEGDGFWVQQPDVSLVRYRQQTAVFRTRANPQPINLLFASAMPRSGSFFLSEEIEDKLHTIADSGRIALTTLQNTSRRMLQDELARQSANVLSLAVAMTYDGKEVQLVLEDAGQPNNMAIKELAQLVERSELSLVVLSALFENQWTAVLRAADELVASGIPAVVVLPTRLQTQEMAQGVTTLLDQLADGVWLDSAVTAARRAMSAVDGGKPVGIDLMLFTSTPHGNIWRSEITAVDLYEALADGFNLAELQGLCFELLVDFKNLRGDGRRGKMVSLVSMMQKENRQQELALAILDARPLTNFAYRQRESASETAVPPALLDRKTLRRILDEQFNLEEIRILCLDLDVNYEDLFGEIKIEKVMSLIDHHERIVALPRLVEAILWQRPNLRERFQTTPEEPVADTVELYRLLVDRFSLDELHDLIFELGIREDDLPGTTRSGKARELVLWMQRYGRLPELVQAIQSSENQPQSQEQQGQQINVSGNVVTGDFISGDKITIGNISGDSVSIGKDAKETAVGPADRQAIVRKIDDSFSMEEFRSLCFEMGVDYENLRGETKLAMIRELVIYAQRNGRLQELAEVLRRDRPQIDWSEFDKIT